MIVLEWSFSIQDPEVMAAFTDVQKNPANAAKYEGNEKVKRVMEKLSATLGAAGMGGAKMGGAGPEKPTTPQSPPPNTAAPPPPPSNPADMDLD